MKVLEKARKNKLEATQSTLLYSGSYKSVFKKGKSTTTNLATVLNEILRTRMKRKDRKIYIAVDLSKAYDNINIDNLLKFLDKRVTKDTDLQILNFLKSFYTN